MLVLSICQLILSCSKWFYLQAVENGDALHWDDSSGESDTDIVKELDSNDDSSVEQTEVKISPIRNGMKKKARSSTSGKLSLSFLQFFFLGKV